MLFRSNVMEPEAEDGAIRLGDGTALSIAGPAREPISGPIHLGIRPEHVRPDPQGPLALTVRMAEPLGASTLLHGRLGDMPGDFTASLPGVHRFEGGHQTIRLAVEPETLHAFDRTSGTRLM